MILTRETKYYELHIRVYCKYPGYHDTHSTIIFKYVKKVHSTVSFFDVKHTRQNIMSTKEKNDETETNK